jgi:hypothetical protein
MAKQMIPFSWEPTNHTAITIPTVSSLLDTPLPKLVLGRNDELKSLWSILLLPGEDGDVDPNFDRGG